MDDALSSLAEMLGGFPAKRARLLLFQIENRTAYLMTQSRRAADSYLTEEITREQDLAFFEALAEGSELPVRPTIRDLERYAPLWQSLVPQNVAAQASLAYLLGQKYRFTYQDIPQIRTALHLEREEVQQAFQHQYQQPPETIYARRASVLESLRWQWSTLSRWLENLPPFWTAYALTFTGTIGAGILALPIALAGVGPLVGVVLLCVIGLINVFTFACLAEAVTRSGSIRYQGGYLGQLVNDYLGRLGSIILTTVVALLYSLFLVAYYIGFSLTLAEVTPVSAKVWTGVLFLTGVYFVRRKTLNATITTALVVGAINLSLILILSVLALGHLRLENLLYVNVPFLDRHTFKPALLGLTFSVVFGAYYGHQSVNTSARTVLQRDPSGRSLIWGCMAGQASVVVLYVLWVVAVNGAIAPQALTGVSGTALSPLARLVGPAVYVLGTILAILSMGMASIHMSLALCFTVREWIPSLSRHTLLLGRRQGKLMLTPRGTANVSLSLTYLGLKEKQPLFRFDLHMRENIHRFEVEVKNNWDATPLLAEYTPHLPRTALRLTVQAVTATPESVRIRLVTPMRIAYEGILDTVGFDFLETSDTPDEILIGWLAGQKQVSVEQVADFLAQTTDAAQVVLNKLVEQGTVSETREDGQVVYTVRFAARRKRQATTAIWQALDDPDETAIRKRDAAQDLGWGRGVAWIQDMMQGGAGRFWLGLSPLILILLLVEWLLVKKLESFSQVLGFLGVVAASIAAGILPVLLLVASRRKGEYAPGLVIRFLAHPVMVSGIYLVFAGNIFLHGLLIWQDTVQRVIALLVGVIILSVTYSMVRMGTFAKRVVIEVRQEVSASGKENTTFTVTNCGQEATHAKVWLGYPNREQFSQGATGAIAEFADLCYVKFHIPATQAQELKVWLHRVTPEGQSENLSALVRVSSGEETQDMKIDGAMRSSVFPLPGGVKSKENQGKTGQLEIEIQLPADTASGHTIEQGGIQLHQIVGLREEDAVQSACQMSERLYLAQVLECSEKPSASMTITTGSERMSADQVTERPLAQLKQPPDVLVCQTPKEKQMAMRAERPTWIEIDLSAIANNTRQIASLVGPEVGVLACLKADAYGHGAVKVARTALLHGANRIGVAMVSEAKPLREEGIDVPIHVFGYIPHWQMHEAVRLDLTVTLYALESAHALSRAAQAMNETVKVHVKVDTGMGRLGVWAEQVEEVMMLAREIAQLPALEFEGIFTHFAMADAEDKTHARMQLARFHKVLHALEAENLRPPLVHAANSAAMLSMPEAHFDLVRPGIALYGLDPSPEVCLPEGFRPALSFKTHVSQVKMVPAEEGISYGCTYTTERSTRVATLPVGYADGFRRAPNNWGTVLIHGQEAPLLGRVCMDQCMIDVTHLPQTCVGDEVVLIGRQGAAILAAEEVARRLGTTPYEVVTEILARVPRIDYGSIY